MFQKLFFIVLLLLNCNNAFAMFNENLTQNRPLSKIKKSTDMVYVGVSGGASALTFTQAGFKDLTNAGYPIIGLTLGYKEKQSYFRHELNFVFIDQKNVKNHIAFNNQTIDLDYSFRRYYLVYNFYLNIPEVLKIGNTTVDFFIGPGIGVSFNKMNIKTKATNGVEDQALIDSQNHINSYNENSKAFQPAFAYEISAGMTFQLSEAFAGQIKTRYSVHTYSFSQMLPQNANSTVTIELGLLFRAL